MKDYISPIEMITNNIVKSADEQIDDCMLFSVERQIGFKVDKEELIKALEYDRKQYEKGFEDGLRSDKEWIPVSKRLPEFVDGYTFSEDVLVTDGFDIKIGEYCKTSLVEPSDKKWHVYGEEKFDVVEWMPLPKVPTILL